MIKSVCILQDSFQVGQNATSGNFETSKVVEIVAIKSTDVSIIFENKTYRTFAGFPFELCGGITE